MSLGARDGAGEAEGAMLSLGASEGTKEGKILGKMVGSGGTGVGEAVIVGAEVDGVAVGNSDIDGERLGGIDGFNDPKVEGTGEDELFDGSGFVGGSDIEGDSDSEGDAVLGRSDGIVDGSSVGVIGDGNIVCDVVGLVVGALVGSTITSCLHSTRESRPRSKDASCNHSRRGCLTSLLMVSRSVCVCVTITDSGRFPTTHRNNGHGMKHVVSSSVANLYCRSYVRRTARTTYCSFAVLDIQEW
jgi:hypothetical protein